MSKFISVIKYFFSTLGCLILVFLVAYLGLYISKFFTYSEYLDIYKEHGTILGINDNFVPQGLTIVHDYNEKEYIVSSGYTSNDEPSRVYIRELNNNDDKGKYVNIRYENDILKGHFGGIAYVSKTKDLYIADDNYLYIVGFDDLFISQHKDILTVKKRLHVNNSASFVFSDDTSIYVGEFSLGDKYPTIEKHHFKFDDYDYKAIISKYDLDSSSSNGYVTNFPTEIYSVRDKVQGFARIGDNFYFSTSFSVKSSELFVHDFKKDLFHKNYFEETISCDGTEDGNVKKIKHYFITDKSLVKTYKLPPMWEDIDIHNGRVYSYNESASNKYIFGKLFFANKYISLPLLDK